MTMAPASRPLMGSGLAARSQREFQRGSVNAKQGVLDEQYSVAPACRRQTEPF